MVEPWLSELSELSELSDTVGHLSDTVGRLSDDCRNYCRPRPDHVLIPGSASRSPAGGGG